LKKQFSTQDQKEKLQSLPFEKGSAKNYKKVLKEKKRFFFALPDKPNLSLTQHPCNTVVFTQDGVKFITLETQTFNKHVP